MFQLALGNLSEDGKGKTEVEDTHRNSTSVLIDWKGLLPMMLANTPINSPLRCSTSRGQPTSSHEPEGRALGLPGISPWSPPRIRRFTTMVSGRRWMTTTFKTNLIPRWSCLCTDTIVLALGIDTVGLRSDTKHRSYRQVFSPSTFHLRHREVSPTSYTTQLKKAVIEGRYEVDLTVKLVGRALGAVYAGMKQQICSPVRGL